MFTHGRLTQGDIVRRLIAAGMLLALLVLIALLRASNTEASAAYLEEDVPEEAAGIEIFLTGENGSAVRGNSAEVELAQGQNVSIHWGETDLFVTAHDETVSELLARMLVEPGPLDMVAVDLTADPVEILVDSELTFYEQEQEVVKSNIVYVDNNILPTWSETVLQQGQDGVKTHVYEVIYSQGKEVSRQLVEESATEAVDTVIERGTLENFAPNDAKVADIITNADGTGTIILENGQEVTFNSALTMKATAYTTGDPGVGTITASGTTVRVGTVAVDRRQIPFGTKLYVVSNDGAYLYGFSIAEDTGGSIKNNRIDLYFNTAQECINFGVRTCTVYVLD